MQGFVKMDLSSINLGLHKLQQLEAVIELAGGDGLERFTSLSAAMQRGISSLAADLATDARCHLTPVEWPSPN